MFELKLFILKYIDEMCVYDRIYIYKFLF